MPRRPRWGQFSAHEWTTVTVPAGTFSALRIKQDRPGFQEEYWYAPAVRWIVKHRDSHNWTAELLSYKLFPRAVR